MALGNSAINARDVTTLKGNHEQISAPQKVSLPPICILLAVAVVNCPKELELIVLTGFPKFV
jgi:hypothetical protein